MQGDPRWRLADPLCTFLFAGLVLVTTFNIVRDISDILMERVPRAHDIDKIHSVLEQVPVGACRVGRVQSPKQLRFSELGGSGLAAGIHAGHRTPMGL